MAHSRHCLSTTSRRSQFFLFFLGLIYCFPNVIFLDSPLPQTTHYLCASSIVIDTLFKAVLFEYQVPPLSLVTGVSPSNLTVPCFWLIVESCEVCAPAYQARFKIDDELSSARHIFGHWNLIGSLCNWSILQKCRYYWAQMLCPHSEFFVQILLFLPCATWLPVSFWIRCFVNRKVIKLQGCPHRWHRHKAMWCEVPKCSTIILWCYTVWSVLVNFKAKSPSAAESKRNFVCWTQFENT